MDQKCFFLLVFICLVVVFLANSNAHEQHEKGDDKRIGLRFVRRGRRPLVRTSEHGAAFASRRRVRVKKVPNVNKEEERDSRFLSLFTVVHFNNEACPSQQTNGRNGTCYSPTECSNRGGSASGSCASGFGVCCLFEFECGRTTSENNTLFRNPTPVQRICNIMINRLNDDICQIRLEFDTFDIAQPDEEGQCTTDFFLASGGSQVPQICGLNTGQHVIYSITPNSGPSQLSVVLDTSVSSSATRSFAIRIIQLECTSRMLAPVGCLQYFMGATGSVRSFNYRTDVRANQEPNHLSSLNYAICIRTEKGFCGVRYSQSSNDPYSFSLTGDADPTTPQTFPLPDTSVMIGDSECQGDHIIIPNGSADGQTDDLARDRFCGLALGRCEQQTQSTTQCTDEAGPVTTYSQPFVVWVITDSDEGNTQTTLVDKANRGFDLNFSQLPCLSVG